MANHLPQLLDLMVREKYLQLRSVLLIHRLDVQQWIRVGGHVSYEFSFHFHHLQSLQAPTP
jgi:hypothetical protein